METSGKRVAVFDKTVTKLISQIFGDKVTRRCERTFQRPAEVPAEDAAWYMRQVLDTIRLNFQVHGL